MPVEIFDCEQGTEEWLLARLAIPTASAFSKVLAKGEGKTRRKYLLSLLGEKLTGEPSEGFSNRHTERGHELEPDGRNAYAFIKDVEPAQVGFIRNGDVGCSPDSLIGDNGLLEIKTKLPEIQLDVLLKDKLPAEHKPQVQGQLWVAEREFCDFVSYWPKLPLFIVRVYRDEDYIKTLAEEVKRFNDELNELEEKIRQKYTA